MNRILFLMRTDGTTGLYGLRGPLRNHDGSHRHSGHATEEARPRRRHTQEAYQKAGHQPEVQNSREQTHHLVSVIIPFVHPVSLPRFCFCLIPLGGLLLTAGCHRTPADTVTVAPGVTFHRDIAAGVQILDVDRTIATVWPIVAAANIEQRRNNRIGDCKTVQEWVTEKGALGGINGGFFGDTYDQIGRRKQIVGLAVQEGKVIAPYDFVDSTRNPGERFLRGAVGFTANGTPDITWATGTLSGILHCYEVPINPKSTDIWRIIDGLGCGPRLYVKGERLITDREERRVSPGKLPRAFIAYDLDPQTGKPHHLILGRADAMEFTDVAEYLTDYFDRVHQSRPEDALCLDGGPSAQLVYRNESGTLEDAEPTGVLVPTAILLVPREPP